MAKYVKRLSAPNKSSKYYYSDNIFYQCGYGMPNCTCYAWGRWYELLGSKPKLCTGNAENWYKFNDGYARGQTPKVGAVAVWRKGQVGNSNDGAGHVAIVEEVYKDGSFLTSNSAWGGANFYTQKYNGNYNNGSYIFLGFIYLPIEFDEDKPAKIDTPAQEGSDLDKFTDVQLACKVWAGEFGTGAEREKKLGARYNAVQKLVNKNVGRSKTSDATNRALAAEVWDGLWGTGETRKNKLNNAGFNYTAVQNLVNRGIGR